MNNKEIVPSCDCTTNSRINEAGAAKKFVKSVLRIGTGTALGQIVVVSATPLITRLYDPTDMGLLGLIMAFVGVAGVGVSFRYDMLIVSVDDDRDADCLLTSSILLAFPTSILFCIGLFVMIERNVLSYRILPSWSILAAAFLLMSSGVFTSLRFWAVRQEKFGIISRAMIIQGFGRAAVPLFCGLLQTGWLGLLLGEMTGRLFGISRMAKMAWPAICNSIRISNRISFFSVLVRNWKAPVVLLPSSIIDAMAAMIPLPLISYMFGPYAAGQFLLVQRLSSLPAGLIASSVADVFHSTIAEEKWNGSEKISQILLKVTRGLLIVACCIYIPVAVISPFIFGFVFGSEWEATGICMTIITPLSMVAFVVSPLSRLLVVIDRIELKFYFDLLSLILPNGGLFLAYGFGYQFSTSFILYVILHIATNVIYYFIMLRASRR